MNTAQFNLSDVIKKRQEAGGAWLEFFSAPNMSMGIYNIPAGTSDHETHHPHDRDEMYLAVSGNGRLTVDGQQFVVGANTVVYVKAGVEHHFHDVTEDLTVLVCFGGRQD